MGAGEIPNGLRLTTRQLKHQVDRYRIGFGAATTFGWECRDCGAEEYGFATVAEVNEQATRHGRVVG